MFCLTERDSGTGTADTLNGMVSVDQACVKQSETFDLSGQY